MSTHYYHKEKNNYVDQKVYVWKMKVTKHTEVECYFDLDSCFKIEV